MTVMKLGELLALGYEPTTAKRIEDDLMRYGVPYATEVGAVKGFWVLGWAARFIEGWPEDVDRYYAERVLRIALRRDDGEEFALAAESVARLSGEVAVLNMLDGDVIDFNDIMDVLGRLTPPEET